MRLLLPALTLLLPGCLDLHCGLHPEWVGWEDPPFSAALLGSAAPEWTVQVVGAVAGIPHDNTTLAAWGATVPYVERSMGGDAFLFLQADGALFLHEVPEPEPEGLRDAVTAALADVTDGNDTERRAWADALLEKPEFGGYTLDEQDREVEFSGYRTVLPPQRIHTGTLLEGRDMVLPVDHIQVGAWTVSLSFPTTQATQGTQTFTADVYGGNTFTDASWEGEFPEAEAVARFQAAYRDLRVGNPPEDVRVGGVIC